MTFTSNLPAAELTPDEEAEMTALNAAAHDLLRIESQRQNVIPPCWLVCSAETKAEYRRKVIDLVRGLAGLDFGDAHFEKVVARTIDPLKVKLWRAAEARFKHLRETGHPHAFFAS